MRSGIIVAVAACLLCAVWTGATFAQPGRVVGYVDGIKLGTDHQYYVFGWACQQGRRDSIDVHVYANHSAYETPAGTFVLAGQANLKSEPAVNQQCRDAAGGNHRFEVALPNQILRTFQNKKLYVHGIAVTDGVENSAIAMSGRHVFPQPDWPADPSTPALLEGARVAVFDTAKDACEQIDIPDAPARAFRDSGGTIHLIASHYVTRASLGTTLEGAKHDCRVVFNSHRDGNPAHFDDYTWLDAFVNLDGKHIVGLGHMEYHGWEHNMCATKTDTIGCWYNTETFFTSQDGGYHFASPRPPATFVASLPYRYVVSRGPEGDSIDTNVVKLGEWYYADISAWGWPPNCGGSGAQACLVPDGTSMMRTANILDPGSWRCWNGKDFTTSFADPYGAAIARPADHICAPLPNLDTPNGLNYSETLHLFVATIWDPNVVPGGQSGLYFTTSADLVHWSKPALAITQNELLKREPPGNWSYAYFSLIDPQSTDPDFSTITDHPYLYYVRSDDSHGPYTRVLYRQRITLDWLAPK